MFLPLPKFYNSLKEFKYNRLKQKNNDMKKTTLFLMSLFLTIGAMAQIRTDKIYTVVAVDHSKGGQPAWAVNNAKTKFVSTGNTAIDDDTQKYFAFIEFNNATYIYSVSAKKFIKNNATLVAGVPQAVTVQELDGGKYLFKFDNDHFINIGGDKQMTIDGWGDQAGEVDGGNTMTLTEVKEFSVDDLDEAVAMLVELYTPTYTGAKSTTGRKLGSFTVNGDTYTLTDEEQLQNYVDKTDKVFIVEPGSEVTVAMTQSEGSSWMNAFVYVDADKNGFSAGIRDNYVPTGDLVSYSFYNNGASSDTEGWNSAGTRLIGDANRNTLNLPSFTAPSKAGTYRLRAKYDWCNINPAGDTGEYFGGTFLGNGAAIVDFTFVVESLPPRRVSVVAGAGGSVSIEGETGTEVEVVGNVNIIATPDYGYEFVNWKKGDEVVSTAASYVYNGAEEANFVAEFRRLTIDEQYSLLSQPTFKLSYGNITEISQIEFNGSNITGFQTALGTTTRLNETLKVKAGETYNLTIGYELNWGDIALYQIDNNGIQIKYGPYFCAWEDYGSPLNILKRDNPTMYEDFGLNSLDDFEVVSSGGNTYMWLPYEISIDEDHKPGDLVTLRIVAATPKAATASEDYNQGRCFDILLEVAQQHTLNVSAAGWASLYLDFPAAIPNLGNDDAGVYIATGVKEGNWLILEKVTDGVLPANTGVIVKAAQGTYDFIYSEDEPANVDGNLLKGSVVDEYIEGKGYVLGNKNGIGFYQAILNKDATGNTGTTHFKNNAYKSYLLASDIPSVNKSAGFRFAFGGTTAVEEVEIENENVKAIYDLTGRKLSEITKPGIYIINGKKVLVK